MHKEPIYKLLIDLPMCPKGRLFRRTVDGTHIFHSMTTEEAITGNYMSYNYPIKIVSEYPNWFMELNQYPEHKKLEHFSQSQIAALNQFNHFLIAKNIDFVDCEKDKTYFFNQLLYEMLNIDVDKFEKECDEIAENA